MFPHLDLARDPLPCDKNSRRLLKFVNNNDKEKDNEEKDNEKTKINSNIKWKVESKKLNSRTSNKNLQKQL